MNSRWVLLVGTILCSAATVGCGSSDDSNDTIKVDPNSPDEVSAVVFIPGASNAMGSPPPQSSSQSKPIINLNDATLPAIAGGEPSIDIDLSATSAPQTIYAQVEGATDFFSVDLPQSNATSGTIRLPLQFDSATDFSTAGQFCVYVCVQDQNGLVSNPGRQCFDALPSTTVEEFTACYDDTSEELCEILRNPSTLGLNEPTLQSINFTGSYARNQQCRQVAPGANVTINTETLAGLGQQTSQDLSSVDFCNDADSCGACFGVFRF